MLAVAAAILVFAIVWRVSEDRQNRGDAEAEAEMRAKRVSMVQCQACGREISKRAESCPHCGEPRARARE